MYPDSTNNTIYKPVFIFKEQSADKQKFNSVISDYQNKIVLDLFPSQMKELIKIKSPAIRLTNAEIDEKYNEWVADKDPDLLGSWIYYPWSNRLLHILNESDFVTLRTSRNHYKITPQEQAALSKRKIGIIGLSVGHAVAVSVATERICGTLKLADFDTIELSNLNRIKTGLHNLGINKCIVTAREIAEIDPYLDIQCYPEGITDGNIAAFLTEHGKLDILVDECDDLEVKISARQMAQKLQIPVVMETSDRGMLDVERFDREADRPILHGMLAGIPPEKLKNIAPADRFPLVMRIIDAMNTSMRGRASLLEIGQTISTWPQLASAVTLGGGVVTDVCRRILLDQFTDSGRYYVDLETIIGNKPDGIPETVYSNPNAPFDLGESTKIIDTLPKIHTNVIPGDDEIRQIVTAGTRAHSAGNDQPWKWVYRNGNLHLFHDAFRSHSFANVNNMAAHLALGAAYENAVLKANQLGYQTDAKLFPAQSLPYLVASIQFTKEGQTENEFTGLAEFIASRSTNRGSGVPYNLTEPEVNALRSAAESISGANVQFITEKSHLADLGKIVAACDLVIMLNEEAHRDFFDRDIRWPGEENAGTGDGIPIQTLVSAPAQMAALSIVRNKKIAGTLRAIGGGNALTEGTRAGVASASCVAVITLPESPDQHFLAGMAAQKLWLTAEKLGLAAQPLLSPLFLFERLGSATGLSEGERDKLQGLRYDFQNIIYSKNNTRAVFLLKIIKPEMSAIQSQRLPLNETLFIVNDAI
ncbi:Rv1355c family protein [Dyadobacter psychrophilus]|uniref:Molybdopterin or thiamine biosynthesis adenylyltransferase n=1 Tax=Dyadobacter psychrophilus TaxID=651661 RepID=A0A1T5BAP6_9BACT|nr:Rv1355c family protein [Dyadobacter psychrophilus]SKB43963.1 Molybdopterin or thiamine biosynthesis adenylyltransferase [Dyadobacter psychrophilus]